MPPKVRIVDRDTGWGRFLKLAKALQGGRQVRVGVLADAGGGAKEEGSDLTVGEIAAIMEFGTKDGHVPDRSYIRSTFDEKREEMAKMAKELVSRVILGKLSVDQALGVLGAFLVAAIKKKVTTGEGVPPPNAPSTIAAKGSDRPLVDTSRMIGATSWVIDDGKAKG